MRIYKPNIIYCLAWTYLVMSDLESSRKCPNCSQRLRYPEHDTECPECGEGLEEWWDKWKSEYKDAYTG
jgi:hypothetical protein